VNHGNPDPASTVAHADKCLLGFQVVIADAENERYEVVHKHKYSQRNLPGWRADI
jgi:hypothetical protein